MDAVLRAAAIYVFLLLVFRITGKRSLAQITAFDFVLLLIVGESTQQALLGDDFSVINACVVIATLMFLELGLAYLKGHWPRLDPILDSTPLIVVEDGRALQDRMAHERVDVSDVLAAARERHGLVRLDQIRFAVLERSGGISIVPKEKA
ncbi:MAG TPA: YetF domain-containing protein [Vicinamibacterales bacterium]|nr:YetF domain-containing protein [Vicinamibacterales bacterium]